MFIGDKSMPEELMKVRARNLESPILLTGIMYSFICNKQQGQDFLQLSELVLGGSSGDPASVSSIACQQVVFKHINDTTFNRFLLCNKRCDS